MLARLEAVWNAIVFAMETILTWIQRPFRAAWDELVVPALQAICRAIATETPVVVGIVTRLYRAIAPQKDSPSS